jgi:uncharacterized protein
LTPIAKIAVISDIHDNLANLERFLKVFDEQCSSLGDEQVCGIICCGDVTTPETLEFLASNFEGPIKLACGNTEIGQEKFAEVAERHKNLEVFAEVGALHHTEQGKSGLVKIDVAFVHRPNKTRELALSGKYSFVFYGHTHRPWIKEVAAKGNPLGAVQGLPLATFIANPGTLGGVFTAPTCAILETQTLKLELHKLY